MPGKPSLGALLHIYSPRYVKSGPGDLPERPEKSPTLWGPLTRKYVEPKKNLTLSRFQFFTMNQTEGQSIESFITEVTLKSKECEFDTDENICDN